MTDPRSDITSKLGTSGWHIALERASGDAASTPYLGDVETVGQVVRAFIAGICDRYAEVATGTSLAPIAAEADRAECLRLGKVFAGNDPAWQTVGAWNGKPLADFARSVMPDHLPELADPEDTLAQVFAVLAHRVYEVIAAFADDADEDTARTSLDGAAEDWTRLLLGLPSQDAEEPDAPEA